MVALKEHFLKLVITALFGVTVYAGQAYVQAKHSEAMGVIGKHATHIEYIREDLAEIKDLLRKVLERK